MLPYMGQRQSGRQNSRHEYQCCRIWDRDRMEDRTVDMNTDAAVYETETEWKTEW